MQITKIELAGDINTKTGLPFAFATIQYLPGKDYFTVTITPAQGNPREHTVQADCQEDIFSMAQCLQHHLDGYDGTNSEVHDYFRLLQYFEK
jgi:predicted solute-binding protein